MSLGRLFGSFDTIRSDVLDGAAMAAGAVGAVVVTNKLLSMPFIPMQGGKVSIAGLLASKVHPALVPATKIILGATAPAIVGQYLPRNAWVRKGLDGAGIGLAVSGWIGLLSTFAATRGLVAQAAFAGAGGDVAVMNGANVGVDYLPSGYQPLSQSMNGAQLGVEEVGKFGGLGNQGNRYHTILGA